MSCFGCDIHHMICMWCHIVCMWCHCVGFQNGSQGGSALLSMVRFSWLVGWLLQEAGRQTIGVGYASSSLCVCCSACCQTLYLSLIPPPRNGLRTTCCYLARYDRNTPVCTCAPHQYRHKFRGTEPQQQKHKYRNNNKPFTHVCVGMYIYSSIQ